MACPALNGFHGVATYSWEKDNRPLSGQDTPLLYSGTGRYKCTVRAKENILCAEFVVNGGYTNLSWSI